jgi:acyl-coenzyme A thioesterase PaaI-like protein
LDEAMGLVVWAAGLKVAAVNLEINYHKPLPLHRLLTLEARITDRDETKTFSTGEIRLEDGMVAVSGRGIYVRAPKLFGEYELVRG